MTGLAVAAVAATAAVDVLAVVVACVVGCSGAAAAATEGCTLGNRAAGMAATCFFGVASDEGRGAAAAVTEALILR